MKLTDMTQNNNLLSKTFAVLIVFIGGLSPSLGYAQEEAKNNTTKPTNELPSRCYFSEKPTESAREKDAPFSKTLTLLSDSSDGSTEKYKLSGNIQASLGNQKLFADEAEYDRDQVALEAKGNIFYRNNDFIFTASRISANLKQESAKIENSQYQSRTGFYHGSADRVTVSGKESEASFKNATYTACPSDQETWRIEASNITLRDAEGWGYAENMVLKVHELPVFYFPKFTFPLTKERKSGFLYPSIRNSNETGLDISMPYYWNIKPNLDATFIPRVLTDIGPHLSAETRYLNPLIEARLQGDYIPEDDRIKTINQNADTGSKIDEERWLFHLQANNPTLSRWNYDVDYMEISDDNYPKDFETVGAGFDKQFIKQRASLKYLDDDSIFVFTVNTDDSLNTALAPYKQLPTLHYTYEPASTSSLGQWSLSSELNVFDSDERVTAERLILEPKWKTSFDKSWGYLQPSLGLHIAHYEQHDIAEGSPIDSHVTRVLPIASLDSAVYLDRYFDFRDKAWMQSIIPRAFFLYVPDENQDAIGLYDTGLMQQGYEQLFRENRFIGPDRVGDSQQVTLALETQFIDLERKFLTISARLGRAYYLDDQEVHLEASDYIANAPIIDTRHSPYILDLRYHINNRWFLTTGIEWEPSPSLTRSGFFRVNYSDEGKRVFNIAHRQFKDIDNKTTSQFDVGVAWPIARRWNFVGRWQTDIEQKRTLESFYGLEYKDCCWAIRIVNHRFLDVPLLDNGGIVPNEDQFERNIFIEFVFGGLTSIGETNAGSFLENSIQGYKNQLGPY